MRDKSAVVRLVRSSLQDHRTKTTRYILFSLNWRKFSIIIIIIIIVVVVVVVVVVDVVVVVVVANLHLRQICKTKHTQDLLILKSISCW